MSSSEKFDVKTVQVPGRRVSIKEEDEIDGEVLSISGYFSNRDSFTVSSQTETAGSLLPSSRCLPQDERGLVIPKNASLPRKRLGRQSNDLSDVTINKLNFKRRPLYGRTEQLNSLQETWKNLNSSDEYRGFVAIAGHAGTGKTTLAESLAEMMMLHQSSSSKAAAAAATPEGLFVRGKFDLRNGDGDGGANASSSGPYSGIARACAEILGAIVSLQNTNADRAAAIQTSITTELGSQLHLLSKFIPALAEVVDIDEVSKGDDSILLSAEESTNQINFSFSSFIRIMTEYFEPLIFTIDDLQWGDDASIALLEALLLDRKIKKILVVGLYRSEEVNSEQHFLYSRLQNFASKSSENKDFEMSQLHVSDLELEDIEKLLCDILQIDNSNNHNSVVSLAKLVKEKTLGNALFLRQYLNSLYARELLSFNFGSMSWEWDEQSIKLQTDTSDNVVALLRADMNSLPKHCSQVLKLGAFLGSTFSMRCIQVLWNEMDPQLLEESDEDDLLLAETLTSLEKGGFLLSLSDYKPPSYSFVHDKIHEAALELLPVDERPAFARHAGEILLRKLDETDVEASFFIIVKLLNARRSSVSREDAGGLSNLEVARCNRRATKKAVAISAFESASVYARHGIVLLPENKWTEDYELALDLYSLGAKAEGYLGNVDTMHKYCRAVLSQNVGKEEDKLRVYNVMIDSMVFGGQVDDAIALILDVLKRFGCKFPSNTVSVVFGILGGVLRVKSTMKKLTSTKLNRMEDPVREELMELMVRLNMCFYLRNDMRYPLTGFRAVKWAAKYGVCGASSIGFAQAGVILVAVLEDYYGAIKYAETAEEILTMTQNHRFISSVQMTSLSGIYAWTRPLSTLLTPLLEAYHSGLRYGDTESATAAIYLYSTFKYMSGDSLLVMADDLTIYSKQMKDLGRLITAKFSRTLLQAFLNLMGVNNVDNPTNLIGDAFSQEGHQVTDTSEPLLWAAIKVFGGILQTFFGEHQEIAEFMVKNGANCIAKIVMAQAAAVLDAYLKGVSCFAAARETGNKNYAKIGMKMRAKIKKWLKAKNPNVKRYDLIVDAEFMAYKGRNKEAIKFYQEAIVASGRGGCRQDAAFACERLGEFHLTVTKDMDEAGYRLSQAREYWYDWGAHAKVKQIDRKYSNLLSQHQQEDHHSDSKSSK